jgi:hypothetical protein
MNHAKKIDYNERLSTAAEAKKALLEKFKPKPMITAAEPIDRAARMEAQRDAIRIQRTAEKEAAREAKAIAAEAARQAAIASDLAALEAKRAERKDRKTLMKMDAQQRRAARLAAYGKASVG